MASFDESSRAPASLGAAFVFFWAAFVAASYFGIQLLMKEVLPLDLPPVMALCVAGALGLGTQLAGPALYAVRRLEKRPFPNFPGERLWICDAAAFALRLAPIAALSILESMPMAFDALAFFRSFGMPILEVASACGCTFLYWAARKRTTSTWWRWTFGACAVTHFGLAAAVGVPLLVAGSGMPLWLTTFGLFVVQLLSTAIALLGNVHRRSWSHWIGALLPFWNSVVLLTFASLYVYIQDPR